MGISGQLSKIGIRATVQKHTIAAHRKVESEGRIAVMVGGYPTGSTPDVSNVVGPRPVQMVHRDYLDVKPSRYANVGFQPGGVNWK